MNNIQQRRTNRTTKLTILILTLILLQSTHLQADPDIAHSSTTLEPNTRLDNTHRPLTCTNADSCDINVPPIGSPSTSSIELSKNKAKVKAESEVHPNAKKATAHTEMKDQLLTKVYDHSLKELEELLHRRIQSWREDQMPEKSKIERESTTIKADKLRQHQYQTPSSVFTSSPSHSPLSRKSPLVESLQDGSVSLSFEEFHPGQILVIGEDKTIEGESSTSPQPSRMFQLMERVHVIGQNQPTIDSVPFSGRMDASAPNRVSKSHSVPSTLLSRPSQSLPLHADLQRVLTLPSVESLADELSQHPTDQSAHAVTATITAHIHHRPLSESEPASASTTLNDSDDAPSSSHPSSTDHEYELHNRVGRGHFGEVWRARRVDSTGSHPQEYILKRLFVENGVSTLLSGRREVHFGLKLRSIDGIARLIEWFEQGDSLWLVFLDEGVSLQRWLTTQDPNGVVKPSDNWIRMRMQMQMSFDETWIEETHDYDDQLTKQVSIDTHDQTEATPTFGPFLPSPIPSTVAVSQLLPSLYHIDSPNEQHPSLPYPPTDPMRAELPHLSQQQQVSIAPSKFLTSLSSNIFPLGDHQLTSVSNPSTSQPSRPTLNSFADDEFKSILYQLLAALGRMKSKGVIHRDVKPANILLRSLTPPNREVRIHRSELEHPFELRLCDLGSAVDEDTNIQSILYPHPFHPSIDESTLTYAPPEVLFHPIPFFDPSILTDSYDMWSVGIIALEMFLGTTDRLWSIHPRLKARIERVIEENWEEEQRKVEESTEFIQLSQEEQFQLRQRNRSQLQRRKEKAVLFRAFLEYGVYQAPAHSRTPSADESSESMDKDDSTYEPLSHSGASSFSSSSSSSSSRSRSIPFDSISTLTDAEFNALIQSIDPLRIGLTNPWLIKLIRRLLVWSPNVRLTVEDALTHSYFMDQPHECHICQQQFETQADIQYHVYTSHHRHPFV